MTNKHLSETVNYGGIEMTRGEMIADLEKVAATQSDDANERRAFVSRYLQGFERGVAARKRYDDLNR